MRKRYEGIVKAGFRHLADAEIKAPFRGIEDFFGNDEMESYRQGLRLWFALSCSDGAYRAKKCTDPSRFVSIHQETIRLIELAWLLYNSEEDFNIGIEHPLYQANESNLQDMIDINNRLSIALIKYCRVLEDREINNVRIVFADFFDFMTLGQWQDELDMLLYFSLKDLPIASQCDNSQLYFPMHELLEKLMEALYMVFILRKYTYKPFLLPEGTVILNRDDAFFPVNLMAELYHHAVSFVVPGTGRNLSITSQEGIIRHFERFPAHLMSLNLRRLYLCYLEGYVRQGAGLPFEEHIKVLELKQFFELLDVMEVETKDWFLN